jgi:hypothetical protein
MVVYHNKVRNVVNAPNWEVLVGGSVIVEDEA